MEDIKCLQCGYRTTPEELERLCSNCFACTGCERFTCPQCGSEIVKKPMSGFKLKKKEDKPEEH